MTRNTAPRALSFVPGAVARSTQHVRVVARGLLRAVVAAIALVALWVASALAERIAHDVGEGWAALTDALAALAASSPTVRAGGDRDAGPPIDAAAAPRPAPCVTSAAPTLPVLAQTPEEVIDEIRAAFCPEAAARLCRARERCGCSRRDASCAEQVEAACSDHMATLYGPTTTSRRESGVPHVELAADSLAACLAGFDALAEHCTLADAVGPDCAWPVRDAVELGEPCDSRSHQCRGGRCSYEGVCTALADAGERSSAAGCAVGLVDEDGWCVRPLGRGAACTYDSHCERGLACRAGHCASHPGRYESCDDHPCAAGLLCQWESAGDRWVCLEGPTWCTRATECGEGYACTEPYGCRPCDASECADGSVCRDTSRCGAGTECVALEAGRCEPTLCLPRALARMLE